MSKLLSVALAVLLASDAAASTISRKEMVGDRVEAKPVGAEYSDSIQHSRAPLERLEIGQNFSFKLTRTFDDGEEQVLLASPSEAFSSEDIIVVKFPMGTGHAKLVLSGWTLESGTKRLFGIFYLYSEGGLFNGVQVSYEPC